MTPTLVGYNYNDNVDPPCSSPGLTKHRATLSVVPDRVYSLAEMPALVTKCGRFEKRWNVGSDEFVIPALLAIAIRLVCFGLTVGVLIYLYPHPSGCEEESIPPFLYGSLFALLLLQMVVMINDAIVFSISARGTIHRSKPRRFLSIFMFTRVFLYFLEAALLSICTYAVSPAVTDEIDCDDYHSGPIAFAIAVVITLWVAVVVYFFGFMFYLDPIGLCSPGLLQELSFLDELGDYTDIDEDGHAYLSNIMENEAVCKAPKLHGNSVGHRRVHRKMKAVCCGCGKGGNRSVAMDDVARAFHTIFADTDIVPSDLVVGLILVKRDQKRKVQECQCLISDFRNFTFDTIAKKHIPLEYKYEESREFDFNNVDERLLFEDLTHYMCYCMGIYGWSLYMFDNILCGLCKLSRYTCCSCNYRCTNQRANVDFIKDNCCMCGVGTVRAQTTLQEEDIRYACFENQVFTVPFSVSVDHKMKAVVLTIRGTLSIQDALTDMSASMMKVPIPGCPHEETFVHKGMYLTALTMKKQHLDNTQILKKTLNEPEHWDYKLVVTGHSLGAGVASILAVLLRPQFPDLVCYAFSPPGCIFSLPLAVYSRQFITTVVLGNDMIPRVTFRSLLYLKRQVLHLLEKCNKPKHQVIFQPRTFDGCLSAFCCPVHEDPSVNLDDVKDQIGIADVVIAKKAIGKWKAATKKKKECHYFVEGVNSGGSTVAFPPGRIVHIKQVVDAKTCLGTCTSNSMKVSWVSSEDLCVIIVDKGIVQDHLPNEVLNAMKRCNSQLIGGQYDPVVVEQRRKELMDEFSEYRKQGRVVTSQPMKQISPAQNLYANEDTRNGASHIVVPIELHEATNGHQQATSDHFDTEL